jgi:aquaporin Z
VELNRKLAVEFIGMFVFMFTVGMVSEKATGAGVLAPLAIGSVLMVMVYAGGPISGGHYNPAVSTGVLFRGKLSSSDWLAYVLVQVVAAVLAGLVVRGIGGAEHPAHLAGTGKMLLVEFIFTFALVYTVLHVATARATEGNSYFGLAIGFIVMAGAFAVGAISGAAFNPAIALGASVSGLLPWSHYWIYLVANLIGGAAAAYAFLYIRPDERVGPGLNFSALWSGAAARGPRSPRRSVRRLDREPITEPRAGRRASDPRSARGGAEPRSARRAEERGLVWDEEETGSSWETEEPRSTWETDEPTRTWETEEPRPPRTPGEPRAPDEPRPPRGPRSRRRPRDWDIP